MVTTPSLFLITLLTSLTFPLPPNLTSLPLALFSFLFFPFLFSNSLCLLPFHPIPSHPSPCPPHPWALAHHGVGMSSVLLPAHPIGASLGASYYFDYHCWTRLLVLDSHPQFPTTCGIINSLQGPPPSGALFSFPISNKQQLSGTTSYAYY